MAAMIHAQDPSVHTFGSGTRYRPDLALHIYETGSSWRFGTVVWVSSIPFVEGAGEKTAPCVVLSSHRYHEEWPHLLVARITSKLKYIDTFGAVEIPEWESVGLDKHSVVKPVIMTVSQAQVLRTLGGLDDKTIKALKVALRSLFGASF